MGWFGGSLGGMGLTGKLDRSVTGTRSRLRFLALNAIDLNSFFLESSTSNCGTFGLRSLVFGGLVRSSKRTSLFLTEQKEVSATSRLTRRSRCLRFYMVMLTGSGIADLQITNGEDDVNWMFAVGSLTS
jgi:hypothetical protein